MAHRWFLLVGLVGFPSLKEEGDPTLQALVEFSLKVGGRNPPRAAEYLMRVGTWPALNGQYANATSQNKSG